MDLGLVHPLAVLVDQRERLVQNAESLVGLPHAPVGGRQQAELPWACQLGPHRQEAGQPLADPEHGLVGPTIERQEPALEDRPVVLPVGEALLRGHRHRLLDPFLHRLRLAVEVVEDRRHAQGPGPRERVETASARASISSVFRWD